VYVRASATDAGGHVNARQLTTTGRSGAIDTRASQRAKPNQPGTASSLASLGGSSNNNNDNNDNNDDKASAGAGGTTSHG